MPEKPRTYELAVNVSADGHRTSDGLHIRLLHQDLSRRSSVPTKQRQRTWSVHTHTPTLLTDAEERKARPRTPVAPRLIKHQELYAHLVAEFLDVGLRELFTLAELGDPTIYFVIHGVFWASLGSKRERWAEGGG